LPLEDGTHKLSQFFKSEDGTDMLLRNVGKKLPLLAV